MNTLVTTPEKSSSISYNSEQVVQALVHSRNAARELRRNLIVADDGCGLTGDFLCISGER